jgi:hypothetical protein
MFGVHIIPPQKVQFTKYKPPEWLIIASLVSGSPEKRKNSLMMSMSAHRGYVFFKPERDHRQAVYRVPSGG